MVDVGYPACYYIGVATTDQNQLLGQLLDQWISDLDGLYAKQLAELDSDYAERRQRLDYDYQKTRERIHEMCSEDTEEDTEVSPPAVTQEVAPEPQPNDSFSDEVSASASNGSYESLSRRELVRRIIPEFGGDTFTASDVRAKFLEKFLEVEPANFPQTINSLLQRMADKGEVKQVGRKGEGPTDPWLYRDNRSQEEMTLGP